MTGLLATRGAVPAGLVAADPSSETPKRKGVRQGGKVLLLGVFLFAFFGLMSDVTRGLMPEELVIIGAIAFLAGMLRMIYAALFEDGPYRKTVVPANYVQPVAFAQREPLPAPRAAELPPAQSIPARAYAPPRQDTSELSFRPSVTEHETQLLDEKRDDPAR